MAYKAATCGLLLDIAYLANLKGDPRGKLYDSKSGLVWHFLSFLDHDHIRAVAAHPDWNETVDASAVIRYHEVAIDPRY